VKRLFLSILILLFLASNTGIAKATDYTQDTNCQLAVQMNSDQDPLTDDSGKGANLTKQGTAKPTYTASGKYGGGFYFDGIDSNFSTNGTGTGVKLGTSINLSSVMWVNLSSTSLQGSFFNLGNPGAAGYCIGVGDHNTFENTTSSGNYLIALFNYVRWIPTGTTIGTGWHHTAIVLDSSGYPTIYLDGVSVYNDTGTIIHPGNPIEECDIGGYVVYPYDRFPDITMDEVGHFNRVLTSTEINDIMDNGLKGSGAPTVDDSQLILIQ